MSDARIDRIEETERLEDEALMEAVFHGEDVVKQLEELRSNLSRANAHILKLERELRTLRIKVLGDIADADRVFPPTAGTVRLVLDPAP